jgi:hypothetical protein
MSRIVALTCEIDIEQTFDSFHAHAIPEGVEIGAGDRILVHGVPADLGFGISFTGQRPATLFRANIFVRLWTRFAAIFEVTELYEVGFQPRVVKG